MSKTKIFCDIADSKTIKEFNKKSIVDGFTTNPSLMRKAGAKSYEKYSKLLLKICRKKPISLEVFADNFNEMEKQALKINSWGKNIYVKIPVVNSCEILSILSCIGASLSKPFIVWTVNFSNIQSFALSFET